MKKILSIVLVIALLTVMVTGSSFAAEQPPTVPIGDNQVPATISLNAKTLNIAITDAVDFHRNGGLDIDATINIFNKSGYPLKVSNISFTPDPESAWSLVASSTDISKQKFDTKKYWLKINDHYMQEGSYAINKELDKLEAICNAIFIQGQATDNVVASEKESLGTFTVSVVLDEN